MRTRRFGIRARITTGSLLIAVAISIGAGFILFTQVQRIVNTSAVDVLRADAQPFEAAVAAGENPPEPGPSQMIAVIDPDGGTVIDTLPRELDAQLPEILAGPDKTHSIEADGHDYVVRVADEKEDFAGWKVISARDAAPQQSALTAMTTLLVVSLALLTAGFGLAVWVLTTIALRPVSRLRMAATSLADQGGSELLPTGPPNDEIAELAQTLNELITLLRAANDRERQIVSDASHELRTPLAIVRTRLELAREEARSIEQLTADIATAETSLDRLSLLANSLLELSRLDAQSEHGSASGAELATELADAADRARVRASDVAVVIEFDDSIAPSDADRRISIDAGDFGRIVDNLTSNALVAVGGDGEIRMELTSTTAGVRLRVSDTGGGMDPEFVARALERFSRPTQSRGGGGAGLGLAIVSSIVTRAGGEITLRNRLGAGLSVVVDLPFGDSTSMPPR